MMRVFPLPVLLATALWSGLAYGQTTPPALDAFLADLTQAASAGQGEVPFAPAVLKCSGALETSCTFTVFDGQVAGEAVLADTAVREVSYQLADDGNAPGALFAAMAITLSALAPDQTPEARRGAIMAMIDALAAGAVTHSADFGKVQLGFQSDTPAGAVGTLTMLP